MLSAWAEELKWNEIQIYCRTRARISKSIAYLQIIFTLEKQKPTFSFLILISFEDQIDFSSNWCNWNALTVFKSPLDWRLMWLNYWTLKWASQRQPNWCPCPTPSSIHDDDGKAWKTFAQLPIWHLLLYALKASSHLGPLLFPLSAIGIVEALHIRLSC